MSSRDLQVGTGTICPQEEHLVNRAQHELHANTVGWGDKKSANSALEHSLQRLGPKYCCVGRSDEKSANSALEQLAAVGSELELHGNTVDWGQENLPNSALEQLAAVGPQLELHSNT